MSMFFEYDIRLNGLDVDDRNQCKASALLNHLQNASRNAPFSAAPSPSLSTACSSRAVAA